MDKKSLREFLSKSDLDLNKYYDPKSKKMKMIYSRLSRGSAKYQLQKKFMDLLMKAKAADLDTSGMDNAVKNFKMVDTVKGLQNKARRVRRRRLKEARGSNLRGSVKKDDTMMGQTELTPNFQQQKSKMRKNLDEDLGKKPKQTLLNQKMQQESDAYDARGEDRAEKMNAKTNKRNRAKMQQDSDAYDARGEERAEMMNAKLKNDEANTGVETGGTADTQNTLKRKTDDSRHIYAPSADSLPTSTTEKAGGVNMKISEKPAVPPPADAEEIIKGTEEPEREQAAGGASENTAQQEQPPDTAMPDAGDTETSQQTLEGATPTIDIEVDRDPEFQAQTVMSMENTIAKEEAKQRGQMGKARLREEIKAFRLLYSNNIKTAKWKSLAKKNPSSLVELRRLHKEYEDEIINYFQKGSLGNLKLGVLISPEALNLNVPALQNMLGSGGSSGAMPPMLRGLQQPPININAAQGKPQTVAATADAAAVDIHYNEGGVKHILKQPLPQIDNVNAHAEPEQPEDANVKDRVQIRAGLSHRFYLPRFNEPLKKFSIKSN